jgi:toxin ParE1/3/4
VQRYRVRRAKDVTPDLDLIEEYLVNGYHGLGDGLESAGDRAAVRIGDATSYMRTFTSHPHRGTEHPDIRAGIRTVTSKRFILYFEIDETLAEVRILAVFFGGVDHRRQIIDRLRFRIMPGEDRAPTSFRCVMQQRRGWPRQARP